MDDRWDDKFFSKRKHIAWRAQAVCDQLIKQFKPKSVVDVGCGIGEFLAYFKNKGIAISGIEGTDACYPHLMVPKSDVDIMDITDSFFRPCVPYDLALCFMVVGRLPENTWPSIAGFLTNLSDTVVTVVEKEWLWDITMKERGFAIDVIGTAIFRSALKPLFGKTAVKSFQHTQIFRRQQ